ncbi:HNH endonuclease [Micromonospora globispora]|uniref:HNH endonuclease n=2 Tax=Micromonospora globispora TaxID=1450148 RepID=A0A317JWM6_9ACTN|nr:HNH endonuclease [Micromonospora globispora]
MAARDQWNSIKERKPVVEGRQVHFLPVETLLCLAASLLVNHRRYGGSTSHKAEEPVPTLARLFLRPNSSVLAKMANLDGSRPNGAKHEVEVSAHLLASPERLAATYRLILSAARSVGIDPVALPDFLGAEEATARLDLLGQEELDQAEVEAAVQRASASWLERRPDLEERVTEKLLVAAARIGQHRFATGVLRNHGHRCVFCGLSVVAAGGERARRMLIASHIKPWRTSEPAERLDVQNGLAACPTHDVAFDTGLVTVNVDLRIHVRPALEHLARIDAATRGAFGRPPLAERLLLPAEAVWPAERYLTWHHEHVYQEGLLV